MSTNGGNRVLHCSFCGKSQHEVRKLIAGPSAYVCDECILLCNEIIQEGGLFQPIHRIRFRPPVSTGGILGGTS